MLIYIYITVYIKMFCMHTFPANVNNEYMCTHIMYSMYTGLNLGIVKMSIKSTLEQALGF